MWTFFFIVLFCAYNLTRRRVKTTSGYGELRKSIHTSEAVGDKVKNSNTEIEYNTRQASGTSSWHFLFKTHHPKKPIFLTIHSTISKFKALKKWGSLRTGISAISAQNGLQTCRFYVPLHGKLCHLLFYIVPNCLFFLILLFLFRFEWWVVFLNSYSRFLVWVAGPPSKSNSKPKNWNPLFFRCIF